MKNAINTHIPEKWDDKVFYFAQKIRFNERTGWEIYINPADCLVGMEAYNTHMPDVSGLRNERHKRRETDNGFELQGRLLFSAGVLFFLDEALLLLQRDALAPSAPLKWTSPAGRADRDPLLTALKEFHEEVIIFDQKSGKPVYVDITNLPYGPLVREVYSDSLVNKGYSSDKADWIHLQASVSVKDFTCVHNVTVFFGDEKIDSSQSGRAPFFTYFDEKRSTLELLLPVTLQRDSGCEVEFAFVDGEYERKTAIFSLAEFENFSDTELVSTMIFLKKEIAKNKVN